MIDFLQSPLLSIQILFEFSRLLLHCFYLSQTQSMNTVKGTFGEYLIQYRYSLRFVNCFLIPFMVAAATCPHKAMLDYPARVVLHMLSCFSSYWYHVDGGVRNVCLKLLKPIQNVIYETEIVGAWTLKSNKVVLEDKHGERMEYDHVVFATQGKFAHYILNAPVPFDLKGKVKKPNAQVLEALSKFEYVPVRVVIHTEVELMPQDQKYWRGINLTTDGKETMANLWINHTHKLSKRIFVVTRLSQLF
jgi:predicted NAD/FAD-binding protein